VKRRLNADRRHLESGGRGTSGSPVYRSASSRANRFGRDCIAINHRHRFTQKLRSLLVLQLIALLSHLTRQLAAFGRSRLFRRALAQRTWQVKQSERLCDVEKAKVCESNFSSLLNRLLAEWIAARWAVQNYAEELEFLQSSPVL
jgi:hypothetical protein